MDGGGRYSGSLNAAGQAGVDGTPAPGPGSLVAGLAARLPRLVRPFMRSRRARFAQPIERRIPRHAGTLTVTVAFAALSITGFVASGRYDRFVLENGRPSDVLARLAGFGVERVTISGISQLYEREVLQAAGIDGHSSVMFLDVAEARKRLLDVPLIASVSVRKVYPNEIVINQVEREPAALWQKEGKVYVISKDGRVIDDFNDDRYAGLPLIVGDDALNISDLNMNLSSEEIENKKDTIRQKMLTDYLGILEASGPLRERISAGTFVSSRRWTLKIDTVDVRLPEMNAIDAVSRLVRLEADDRILEKDIIAIDLRMPDRITVRLSEEAAAVRAETQRKPKKSPI